MPDSRVRYRHCTALTTQAVLIFFISAMANDALAHGFGPRYQLPIPLGLYVAGAGLTVALSFAAFVLFLKHQAAKTAGSASQSSRTARGILLSEPWGKILSNGLLGLRVLFSLGFFFAVFCGLYGSQNPFQNPLPVLIWLLGWIGVAFICILFTDVWRLVNPWTPIIELCEKLYLRLSGKCSAKPVLNFSASWGVWPAFLLFLCFAWMELIWPSRSDPSQLAIALLIYSAITLLGMGLFGRKAWSARCEFLTLVFGLFARFSPVLITKYDGYRIVLRKPGLGLQQAESASASMTFLILALLSTVTFDGLLETWVWAQIDVAILASPLDSFIWTALNLREIEALLIARSLGLLASILCMTLGYLLICWLMSRLSSSGTPGTWQLARKFIFSLIPISLAYHIAHYFAYLFIGGQSAISLFSDPLGLGWDLFGTADFQTNTNLVSPGMQWAVALSAVVIGHVVSIYLSHTTALRVFRNSRDALVTQTPMALFMVAYTMSSLWILAQPITAS